MYSAYIIYIEKIQRYYVGSTSNVDSRLTDHNNGKSIYTSKGRPWILIKSLQCETRSKAIELEKKIKGRGAKRYLDESI